MFLLWSLRWYSHEFHVTACANRRSWYAHDNRKQLRNSLSHSPGSVWVFPIPHQRGRTILGKCKTDRMFVERKHKIAKHWNIRKRYSSEHRDISIRQTISSCSQFTFLSFTKRTANHFWQTPWSVRSNLLFGCCGLLPSKPIPKSNLESRLQCRPTLFFTMTVFLAVFVSPWLYELLTIRGQHTREYKTTDVYSGCCL